MIGLLSAGAAPAAAPAPPAIVSGGPYTLGKQPDGNSVIFEGARELVVFDTGRHPEHQAKILAFARARGKPVAAIVNSHWHLDHSGGNQEIRAAFPRAKLYASDAVEGALDGFLARSLASGKARIADGSVSDADKADTRLDVAAIGDRKDLIPDVPVTRATVLPLRGRWLELHLAPHAATAGDVWAYDPATRTLAAGDLVVLPAPFFDTACPEGWRRALAAIAKVPFERLVPGHGEPMSHAQFDRYRTAYDRLVDCSESGKAKETCIAGWQKDASAFLAGDEERKTAAALLNYYFEVVLRSLAKKKEYCDA